MINESLARFFKQYKNIRGEIKLLKKYMKI